jgi:hypothetical protein
VSNLSLDHCQFMKHREHHFLWGLCAFVLMFNLFAHCQNETSLSQKAKDEQNIREVVIRQQMEEWIKGGDKSESEAKDKSEKAIAKMLNFKIFFISIDGKDPSDDFMNKFQDLPRVIKKVSASEISKAWRLAVIDRSSHQRGIRFSADEIRWLGPDSVEVKGGYHCDGLCGAGIKFEVRRENGHWLVKASKMEWIS